MSLAFVFPGQGSQAIGMMGALAKLSLTIEATFREASAKVASIVGETFASALSMPMDCDP